MSDWSSDVCSSDLGSYSYAYGDIPRHQRKSHWAEFWIFTYTWHYLSPRKRARSQVMSAFVVRDTTPSSAHNLTLHVSFVLCMGDMALPSWLTLASMCCMHTSLMISPLLRVYDWIVMLRDPRFCLVRISIILVWANHRLVRTWLFHFQRWIEISFRSDQVLPTDGVNCKDQFWFGP